MSRQFFKNAGFLAITEIIVKLKGIVILPLLTHHFGAANFGIWSQLTVLVGTMIPLIVMGSDAAVIRYLPGRQINDQKRFFDAWVITLLSMTTIVCLIILLWKSTIAGMFFGTVKEYELYIPLAAASLFVTISLNCIRNWYRIVGNSKTYGIIAISQAVCNMLIVFLILLFDAGVYHFVLYSVLCDTALLVWFMYSIQHKFGWNKPDFTIIPTLLKYGLPLVPAGFAMWGLNYMDRLFLIKYSSIAEIGVYSLAYSLGYLVIQVLINPIWAMYANTAAALFNQGDRAGVQKLFDQSIGGILFFSVPVIVGLAVLGKPAISLVASKEFLSGAPLISIVASGYLFHMLASYYEISLGLISRQFWSTISLAMACGINLILNLLLIPKYTVLGAAIATCMSFVFQFVFSLLMASHYKLLRTNLVYPLKIILASTFMGVGLYYISLWLSQDGIMEFTLKIILGTALYGVFIMVFRTVPPEILELLRTSIKKKIIGTTC